MSGRRHVSLAPLAVSLISVLIFALGCLAGGCSDSTPPVKLDGKAKKEAGIDMPPPDVSQRPDQLQRDNFKWPDQRPPDTQPWPPPDSYVPAPFGCQTDTDCFGQKCCSTPWGVKLCAPTCDLK